MEPDEAEILLEMLAPLRRSAWLPLIADGDCGLRSSKFSGIPWLGADESWPTCPRCAEPLAHFLQLDLANLPPELEGMFGKGLLQMFFCVSRSGCTTQGADCFEPFSPYQVLRLVQPDSHAGSFFSPHFSKPIPARSITGWTETDDCPHPYECEERGFPPADGAMDALDNLYPRQSDKLAGRPAWVQHIHYPHCRRCHQTMRLVSQLDSDCGIQYMFGDNGGGHITQCPDHLDELAFVWACM